MTVKDLRTLVTNPGSNEQSGVHVTTVTGAGNSREYPELGSLSTGVIFLDVTAMSGTAAPTLTVNFQGQDPVSLKWHTLVSFPAQTAVTGAGVVAPLDVTLKMLNYRLSWTVTGTNPSFTFSCCIIATTEEGV